MPTWHSPVGRGGRESSAKCRVKHGTEVEMSPKKEKLQKKLPVKRKAMEQSTKPKPRKKVAYTKATSVTRRRERYLEFKCTYCNEILESRDSLKDHTAKSHSGERPFVCTYCFATFVKLIHLRRHTMTHTGEKPFSCDLCADTFRQKSGLVRHRRKHTGERPHACTFCERRFSDSTDLKRHIMTHTGEKPFGCTYCGTRFTQRSHLTNHKFAFHGHEEKLSLLSTMAGRRDALEESRKFKQTGSGRIVNGLPLVKDIESAGSFSVGAADASVSRFREQGTSTEYSEDLCWASESDSDSEAEVVLRVSESTTRKETREELVFESTNHERGSNVEEHHPKQTDNGLLPEPVPLSESITCRIQLITDDVRLDSPSGFHADADDVVYCDIKVDNIVGDEVRSLNWFQPSDQPPLPWSQDDEKAPPDPASSCSYSPIENESLRGSDCLQQLLPVVVEFSPPRLDPEGIPKPSDTFSFDGSEHPCDVSATFNEVVQGLTERDVSTVEEGERPSSGSSDSAPSTSNGRSNQSTPISTSILCDICGASLKNRKNLQSHRRIHSEKRPFCCPQCPKTFRTPHHLRRHEKIHSGERPYQCDKCPAAFTQSGGLQRHMRTHTGERPFQCNVCQRGFMDTTDLKRHVRIHTGERPHVCEICGTTFTQIANLKSHYSTHLGQFPRYGRKVKATADGDAKATDGEMGEAALEALVSRTTHGLALDQVVGL